MNDSLIDLIIFGIVLVLLLNFFGVAFYWWKERRNKH